jgi:hypothetical protein
MFIVLAGKMRDVNAPGLGSIIPQFAIDLEFCGEVDLPEKDDESLEWFHGLSFLIGI